MEIICIGRRCNSTEFVRKYNLTDKTCTSSPFDWDFICLESVIYFLNCNFKNYTNDIYMPWENKIINNTQNYEIPKTQDFIYLRINLRGSHKNFGLNLNTVQNRPIDPNLYTCLDGLYFFHYNFCDESIVAKKQNKINEFLSKKSENILLFCIWSILKKNEISTTIEYIQNVLKKVTKPYRFLFVFPIDDLLSDFEIHKMDRPIYFVSIKVPPLTTQLSYSYNENNLDNPEIKWKNLYNFIVDLKKDFPNKT